MATQTVTSHKRVDSAVNGIEPLQDIQVTAQSFCKAVAFLASEHGFKMIDELVASAPQRELEIKTRDQTIQDLRDEIIVLRKERDDFNNLQLSNFERRYEDWKEENTTLKEDIDEVEVALEETKSKVVELQNQLENLEARANDLESENAQMTAKVKERGQKIGMLEAKLQHAHADLDGRAKEIEKVRNHASTLQDSFDNEANQHRVLREEANKIRARFKELLQYSVKFVELDLADVTNRMEQLWTVATALVEEFFGRKLPDSILENDWTGLRNNDIFKHQIPLPQSNTDAARKMRAAIILGALTRLIDRFVFQPTYLLDEQSGLRGVLLDEAGLDPMKERYVRGILLSMSPDEQQANGEGIVHVVTQQLLDVVNLKALLTPETFNTFPEALSAFVRQCQVEWKIVQRGKQKLEPDFNYLASSRDPWKLFGAASSETSNQGPTGQSPATTAIDNNIVLIPRIYLVMPKAEPNPITHGCVLGKTHLDAAAEEMRNSLPNAPFTQASSSRHRSRPSRAMSVSGNGRSFLV